MWKRGDDSEMSLQNLAKTKIMFEFSINCVRTDTRKNGAQRVLSIAENEISVIMYHMEFIEISG